jgi:putative endonuclease
MGNIALGKLGEDHAVSYLVKNGFTVVERNYRTKSGEIDIVAQQAGTIYFIEVKTRTSAVHGKPYEAVTYGKQVHMRRSAEWYVLKNNLQKSKLRLAVVSVEIQNNTETVMLYELD